MMANLSDNFYLTHVFRANSSVHHGAVIGLNRTTATPNFADKYNSQPWNALTITHLVSMITGFLSNSFLLSLFACQSSLRTPFNIYLINLLIANTCMILVYYPLAIAKSFFIVFYWNFGEFVCTLNIYANWTLEAAMFNSHLLIALNRLWALFHPVSYRTHHTAKIAVVLCITMWTLIHLATLPAIILDGLFYRLPAKENGCFFSAEKQPIYDFVLNVILFDSPQIVMWCAFPMVITARLIRQRKMRGNVVPIRSGNSGASNGTKEVVGSNPGGGMEMQKKEAQTGGKPSERSRGSRGTLVLGILTLAITICWTPMNVYFFWKIIDPKYTNLTFRTVSLALFAFQTTVDPVVFALALPQLQDAIRGLFLRLK